MLAQNDAGTQTDAGAIALPTVEVTANKEGETPGSSQTGAGLGGRFTGYTVDLNTPAQVGKDKTPIIQTPFSINVVPRQVMDDEQAISLQDSVVGNVSGVLYTAGSFGSYNQFIIRVSTTTAFFATTCWCPGDYILDNGHGMLQAQKRQAGARKFGGIFAFEALRRIFDDAVAEEFLLVKYQFKENSPCAADIHGDSVNLFDCDQIDAGLELPSSGHS